MKSKTILGADGATKMRQITVGIHGNLQITGYCKCCVDCNFIDQKGADELMCLAAYLAGNEQARAEAQQKAGKKA